MQKVIVLIFVMLCNFVALSQEIANDDVTKRSGIVFRKTVHDFGAIKMNDETNYTFTFKNCTKEPITIRTVATSCGCTAAEWSEKPVAKRKKGHIKIGYDTSKVGRFTEIAKVYIEGQKQPLQLEIRGTVIAPNANDYYK